MAGTVYMHANKLKPNDMNVVQDNDAVVLALVPSGFGAWLSDDSSFWLFLLQLFLSFSILCGDLVR